MPFTKTEADRIQKLELEIAKISTILKVVGAILVPILGAGIYGIVQAVRQTHAVEVLEQNHVKFERLLQETRDNMLIRREEAEGAFVKAENNRLYIGSGDEITSYALHPTIDRTSLQHIKQGARIRLSLARSIDGNVFVISVHDTFPLPPPDAEKILTPKAPNKDNE